MAAKDIGRGMADHKFRVGQTVKLAPERFASNRHPTYTVLHCLPAQNGMNRYRIKSVWNGSECEVRETELS